MILNVPTFEQVMLLTSVVSGEAAFELPECKAYYDLLASLPNGASVMEIGLQFGRSSSILMQLLKAKQFTYYGVDPFTDPPEAQWHFKQMLRNLNCNCILFPCKTEDLPTDIRLDLSLDLLLVDGDHSAHGVFMDCALVCPQVKPGGFALFHDYGKASLPDVYPEVNRWMSDRPWVELPTVGTLGIWKRV